MPEQKRRLLIPDTAAFHRVGLVGADHTLATGLLNRGRNKFSGRQIKRPGRPDMNSPIGFGWFNAKHLAVVGIFLVIAVVRQPQGMGEITSALSKAARLPVNLK